MPMQIYATSDEAMAALAVAPFCTEFPNHSGVYAFIGGGVTWYIGESRNLRVRLTTHELRRYLKKAVRLRCKVLVCANFRHVERWLIAALKPPLNRAWQRAEPGKRRDDMGVQHDMHIQAYALNLLDQVIADQDVPIAVRKDVTAVAHKLRYPMADILAKVPGATLAERARAIGVSRQTCYVWMRETTRPSDEQARVLSKLTGIPTAQIRANGYMEGQDDVRRKGKGAKAGRQLAKDGESVSRRAGRVRSKSGRMVFKPSVGGSPRTVRKRTRRRTGDSPPAP